MTKKNCHFWKIDFLIARSLCAPSHIHSGAAVDYFLFLVQNDLVLQKIHALPYLEDEYYGPYAENVYEDGPAVGCASYLATMSHPKWLFRHVSDFVHLLKPGDVLNLAKLLINYCQLGDEEEIAERLSSDLRELRYIVFVV